MTTKASSIFGTLHRALPFGFASRRSLRDQVFSQLGQLDDRMLRDIGLSRHDLEIMRRQW